jgi:hypothetical protein
MGDYYGAAEFVLCILFTVAVVILTSSLAAAVFTPEAITISYQINNSARIVIGTVSKIDNYNDYKIID